MCVSVCVSVSVYVCVSVCVSVCVEGCCQFERGAVSIRVQPGHLPLGKPGG